MSLFSCFISSPIGDVFALANNTSLLYLDFADSSEQVSKMEKIKTRYQASIISEKNTILNQARKELEEYFVGKRKTFSIPLEFSGTDFQERSWK